jgi:hypothetical protein
MGRKRVTVTPCGIVRLRVMIALRGIENTFYSLCPLLTLEGKPYRLAGFRIGER